MINHPIAFAVAVLGGVAIIIGLNSIIDAAILWYRLTKKDKYFINNNATSREHGCEDSDANPSAKA